MSSKPKIVAIMQPTYLPWLGYLAMINKVDQFVFLDTVQFEKRSWQQRNRIKTDTQILWLTLPVINKGLFEQKINEVVCLDLEKNVKKHLNSFNHCYKKAKNYNEFYPVFANFMQQAVQASNGYLSHFNINIIKFLCEYSGIDQEFILASELQQNGIKAELLATICQHLNAQTYLSAPGSKTYLEESDAFEKRGIEIAYHNYNHPQYPQLFGEFIAGMSCVDAFFNVEKEKLKNLIMSGCI